MSEPRQSKRQGRQRDLSGPAAARHRRLSLHDRAAVRGPREVHQRAGRGHARGQADPARGAEECRRRRSRTRCHLSDGHAGLRAAAAEAARRHRQGAGGGHRARQGRALRRQPRLLRGRGRARQRGHRLQGRDRGARPLGAFPSSRATSSSTRRSRPRCSAPSARSTTTPSSPTPSPRIWRSRSPTSRRCSRSPRSPSGWSASIP